VLHRQGVAKALILSVCLALVGVPLWAARDPHPGRGLKRALVGVALFNVFYVFILRVLVPRFG
jgi:hypothetical protein